SKLFGKRRYDMERVLPGGRQPPELQFKSLTYWRSGNLGPRDSGRSPRGMATDLFWQFRCSARSGFWALWRFGERRRVASPQRSWISSKISLPKLLSQSRTPASSRESEIQTP